MSIAVSISKGEQRAFYPQGPSVQESSIGVTSSFQLPNHSCSPGPQNVSSGSGFDGLSNLEIGEEG